MHCREDLKERLDELQEMMKAAADGIRESGRAFIIVFEGLDASGKSGCIKRVTKTLDPFQYSVIPTAKPTEAEYRHHYLKRFWDTLPEYGKIAVYDRSWYGRVLVERVEGLASRSIGKSTPLKNCCTMTTRLLSSCGWMYRRRNSSGGLWHGRTTRKKHTS